MIPPTTLSTPRRSRWFVAAALTMAALIAPLVLANDELLTLQTDNTQWVMPNGNYAGWNYSELNEINVDNVGDLRVEWTFQTGVNDSHEGQIIVVGDTMYLLTPKPNVLYALDLTRQGTVKWSFSPDQPNLQQAIAVACCGAQSRGVSYADGKLVFNTLDGQLFGVDAASGEVLWRTEVANLDISETTTTAPLIVHNHAIIGVAGGERGVRGWVAAYDLDTGAELWKFYNTGPNAEMGIGERFKPFYPSDMVEEPGTDSWFGDSWRTGGGTVWGWWSYDPELDYFYYSTGNCGPWNPDYRRDPATAPGLDKYLSKYCAALIARDATTGEMVWANTLTPQDQWDLDEPGGNPLVDLMIDGVMRHTIVKPARNGFFYVIDRVTGEIINDPWTFTSVNWATGFDGEAGMPIVNEEKIMYTDVPVTDVCPWIAARNWENDAYSPSTGLIYFTAINVCGNFTAIEGEYKPGELYILFQFQGNYTGSEYPWRKNLLAVDPVSNQIVWEEPWYGSGGGIWSKPIMATAGDLIFQGTQEGEFVARHAGTGERLWSFRTGTDFRNSPTSYVGPDGRQYIAVIGSGAPLNANLAADAAADAEARYRRASATVYVFAVR
jgi:lanthanide-dependent methanol dehydrogenase